MGFGKAKDRAALANEINDAARLAIGNSGRPDPNNEGKLMGTTRAERESGQNALDRMVKDKVISKRQAKAAKEAALRQAGAQASKLAKRFGR
jgi:hypothetical protein